MTLEPNTKFAVTALAETNPDFDGSVAMPPHYVFTTTCPFELDSGWQHWLGSIAADGIQQSDFFMLIHEPARQPDLLDDQNTALLDRCESTLMALHLRGIPGYSSGHEFTGSVGPAGGISIRQVARIAEYRESCRSIPCQWTATDVKTAVELEPTISEIRSDKMHYQQLRRGLGAYLSALEAIDCRDRLHQAVRSLEALTASTKDHYGRKYFEGHYQTLIQPAPPDGFLGELYQLRSYVEHLEDAQAEHLKDRQFAQKIMDKDKFARFFEQREAQAVDLARSIYSWILSTTSVLDYFKEDADIPKFWTAVENKSVRPCKWTCPVCNDEGILDETE